MFKKLKILFKLANETDRSVIDCIDCLKKTNFDYKLSKKIINKKSKWI